MDALKIALVSAEITPFAKTGGLADVVAALGRALHRKGHDVRLFLPLYGTLWEEGHEFTPVTERRDLRIEFPSRTVTCSVFTATMPTSKREDGTSLEVEFLDCPELYHRDGYYTSDSDEPVRWATLCRGVLDTLSQADWSPDVVHCNDWHTGLLPLYLRTTYQRLETFESTRTLLSIHNLAYQGIFGSEVISQLGLSDLVGLFHQERLGNGQVSFLETGILYADWLSTVSETYAREIQGAEHGAGLDELLRARTDHLVGIVNGVDTDEWNPDTDELISHRYSAADLTGKVLCKKELLDRFGLARDTDSTLHKEPMVLGIVSRLTSQKGFELLPSILPTFLEHGNIRLVVLGSGERRYEQYFQDLRDSFPNWVGVYFGYSNELAHWIEAGADVFLMPSRFEPCGLNQMFSLRYGTVPLVRHTGGLADTVQRWDAATRTGTGFVFHDFTPHALSRTIDHALEVWEDRPSWETLMQNAMAKDLSWERQSTHYVDLYRRMLAA